METRNKIAFSFYIKRTRPLKNGEVPIYAKITVDEIYEELAIIRSILPEKWDTKQNGANKKMKDADEINSYIQHVRSRLQDHVKLLYEKGKEITARSIKNSYLGIDPDNKKVVALFEDHNTSARLLKGKDFAAATIQRYETCLLHVKNYIKEKYKVDDMGINKVNPDFIKGFELYLKTVRNCNHNSTVKYIRNLKKIVLNAFQNGWLRQDPFANIKLRLNKVDRGFLSEEELSR